MGQQGVESHERARERERVRDRGDRLRLRARAPPACIGAPAPLCDRLCVRVGVRVCVCVRARVCVCGQVGEDPAKLARFHQIREAADALTKGRAKYDRSAPASPPAVPRR